MSINGHQVGPIGTDEMTASIRTGNLQPGTYVYTQGMQNWVKAGEVDLFQPYFDEKTLRNNE